MKRISTPPMAGPKPAKNAHWLTVRNQGDVTEMIISGHIGASWWDDSGTTSKEFRDKFGLVPRGTKINVRINSEGGSVADALEIYNVIQARKDDVTCYNDGYALSSASVILCAGGKAVTPHASLTMIHEPWSMTVGDESDHLKAAQMLAKHGDTIAQIYARKTGKPVADMREAMKTETWFTGAEAADYGFSETDPEETEEEELIEDRFKALDLSPFKNVPKNIAEVVSGFRKGNDGQDWRKQMFQRCAALFKISTPSMASGGKQTPNAQIMDKKKILAALKARGVELAEDASEEKILEAFNKLNATPPTPPAAPANPPPPPANPPANNDAEMKSLRDQLENERRVRISAEVQRRGANKIENKLLKRYIDMAMKDEVGTYEMIDAMALQNPGGPQLGISFVTTENRLEEIKKETSAVKRFRTLRNEWDGLIKDAIVRDGRQRMAPMASNTYSASLVTQFLLDGAVTKLQNRWAALRVFSKDYSTDRYKPRATGQLKFVTSGNTVEKNATNFETGDSIVSNTQIAVDQYTSKFHVTNDELNSGLRMENLVDINVAALADKILGVAFSPLDTGSVTTNTKIIRAASAFSFSDMATAWGQLKKSPVKYAVLDGEYMARIINQPVFYQATGTESGGEDGWKRFGWDGVYLNTNWTGTHAGANDQNIRGLFCNPQILGAIAGLPLTPPAIPGATLQESTMTVPEVDVSVAAYSWFSLATRTMWMSYDLMFGSALLDETAGVLLTSA